MKLDKISMFKDIERHRIIFKMSPYIIGILIAICIIIPISRVEPISNEDVVIELGEDIPLDSEFYIHFYSNIGVSPERALKHHRKTSVDITDVDKYNIGQYKVYTTYKNKTVCTIVSIVDTTAPKASLKSGMIETGISSGIYARDLVCNIEDLQSTNIEFRGGEDYKEYDSVGIKEEVIEITDASDNKLELLQTIYVVDDIEPIIHIEKVRITGNNLDLLEGVTAYDNIDGDLTEEIEVYSDLDLTKPGQYVIMYSVKDKSGNKAVSRLNFEVIYRIGDSQSTVNYMKYNELVIEESVPDERKNQAQLLYNRVPNKVKELIRENKGKVLITMDESVTNGHAGMCYVKEWPYKNANTAAIYANTDNKVNIAVIHEIGHLLDNYLGHMFGGASNIHYTGVYVSECEEYEKIFSDEVANANYASYNSTDVVEFFAETFRRYCNNKEDAKENTPRAIAFLEKYLDMI